MSQDTLPRPGLRPHIVAVTNQKGGCGKTTTAVNLAGALGQRSRRVLVVDWDPQANATLHAGLDPEKVDTIWHTLQSHITSGYATAGETEDFQALLQQVWNAEPKEANLPIIASPNDNPFDLVASSLDLSAAESELIGAINRERCLAALLEPVTGYDYIIIDCAPTLGVMTTNALAAADSVIIPLETSYFSVRGMNALFRTLVNVRKTLNPTLSVAGILLTKVDHRTTHSKQVVAHARGTLDQMRLFDTVIPMNASLVDASAAGQCITLYAPRSPGAKAYRAVAKEFDAGRDL